MNDLILKEPGQLFQTQKPIGMDGMTERELGIDIPRLQLVHAIRSRNDIGRPGQWKLNGQLFDSVPVVVLKGHHFRTLTEGEGNKARTVCASYDGRTPHDQVPDPKSDNCPHCPYSQWKDGVGGKRIAPPCADGLALLTLVLQPAPGSPIPVQPAWILCRKGARQKASDLGRGIVDRGARTFADFRVSVTAEEKRNEGVVWWEPVFTIGEATAEYSPVAHYVEDNGIHYVPPVFATAVAESPVAPASNGEADPWDVPV